MTRVANGFLILLIFLLAACGQQTQQVVISTTPSNLTLLAGDPAQAIRVNLQNSASTNVTWSLSPNLGSLDSNNGLEVRYTPPTNIPSETTITITVALNNSTKATSTILLKPRNEPNLTLSPNDVSLTAGDAAFSFTAILQNTDANVVWSLSKNLGSLSGSSGESIKYTPPSTITGETTVVLTAQLQGTNLKDTATITLKPKPTAALSISPKGNPILTLSAGSPSQTFKASTQNTSDIVTWSLSSNTPTTGSLNQTSGLEVQYTPPTYIISPQQVTLIASLANGTIQDSVSLTIEPLPISLDVSPGVVSLTAGDEARVFSATVENSPAEISWTLSPSLGNLNTTTGSSVFYTPPASIGSDTLITLTARLADGSAEFSSHITVQPKPVVSLQVNPVNVSLGFGATPLQLNAMLQNSTGAINWTLSPNIGSLSATTGNSVQYIPPSVIGNQTSVTITAALADGSIQSSSVINLTTPQITCSGYYSRIDAAEMTAYSSKISYMSGENLELKVSSPSSNLSLAIYQETQTGSSGKILRLFQSQVQAQKYTVPVTPYATNLNWPTAFSQTIPSSWPSGLYNAIFFDKSSQYCFEVVFVVKPTASQTVPPIAVLASNYTWQAYNAWGGASMYTCATGTIGCVVVPGGSLVASIVTTQRPNSSAYTRRDTREHLALGTLGIIDWLVKQGYPYSVITDADLDSNPQALNNYRILIMDAHSEYWTRGMYDRLEQFLARGGNLVNWGGNQIYWKTVSSGDQIEVRKDRLTHTLNGEPGGLWRELSRPEAAVLGVRFTSTGGDTYASYSALLPSHWALAGTGLQANQAFAEGCSGWEIDKVDPAYRPAGLEIIARGNNVDAIRTGQAGADMTYYKNAGGGGVFSAGSLAFGACRNDPVISKIMHNVVERFLGH